MPTYITLLRWTPQGLQRVKESPSRLEAARKAYQSAGVKMKDFYMVTGQYDFVVISEAPDDGVMARVNLSLASAGNVQTETLRAFTEEEYRISGTPTDNGTGNIPITPCTGTIDGTTLTNSSVRKCAEGGGSRLSVRSKGGRR